MAEMPEDGRFEYGPRDPVTGERWVYVSREMARAHPKGGLDWRLYAIIVYLVGVAAAWFVEFVFAGYALSLFMLSLLPMLAALGLVLRSPFALVLVVIIFAMGAFRMVTNIGAMNLVGLGQILMLGFFAVYLLTGERPNLIYRHRYRSVKGPK